MPSFTSVADGVIASARPPEHLSTTYLDTDDLRLARWGVSLRHRAGEGWTVKLPAENDPSLLVRTELTFAGNGSQPPVDAVDLVRAFIRTGVLRPQTSLQTLRRHVELHDAEGRVIADVVDDDVSVLEGSRTAARFREIEVEISDDTPSRLLEAVVALVRQAGAGRPDPMPKYLRALGPRALQTPEIRIPRLGSKATRGDVLRRAIACSALRLIQHDPVVRLDDDPEGVHQMRVATRRLRSDLRTFRSWLDPAWTTALREELGWFAQILGAVRDGDVLLGRIRRRSTELAEPNDRGLALVLASIEGMREAAQVELLATLRAERYLALLDCVVAAASAPHLLRGGAEVPAAGVLPGLVRRPWGSLANSVGTLPDRPTDEELHKVRIKAKRFRYASEAIAPVLGSDARKLARRAAALQDVLGSLNDAVFAERWLRDWALRSRSGRGAFTAGELAGLEWVEAQRCRAGWGKMWKRLSSPKLRAWM
jgi:CHAD domain-containing protein